MKIYYTFDEIKQFVESIAHQARNEKFDAIVGVTRGGLIPATILSHMLDVPMHTVTITTRHEWSSEPDAEVTHLVNKLGSAKNILVVDDIADTGLTLGLLKKYLDQHSLTSKYATIIAKTQSAFTTDYFGVNESSDAWIVFPWETE